MSEFNQAGTVDEAVINLLSDFLAARRQQAADLDERLLVLHAELESAIRAPGKRLRPLLACWGHRAAGAAVGREMLQAAAALELLHTFALIQDDVIDRAPTRRGRPASHIRLAAAAQGGRRDRFGESAAILLGDLALIWSGQLLVESGFPPELLQAGLGIYHELCAEVTLGQYLDIVVCHTERLTEEDALRVNRYKTACYTVQRPIQLGMALAGAPASLLESVPGFAVPAGIAFQLRDDQLGAFGDPGLTGKPSGQDLLERKPTWLWARTLRLRPDAARLQTVSELRAAALESGAAAAAEAEISRLEAEALAALRAMPVAPAAEVELEQLTERLIRRNS
ncbi:MAG: polyprenyl synthetase family protein [Candidatus Dormibacteraeota bacterium]|nr:polyprenyl synthetase family protein [Candidatus Dormibacteraeota bacterium]